MSAVFFTLLSNATDRANSSERVVVSTREDSCRVQITVQDDGRGLSEEDAATVFQPVFRMEEGRMSTGNWSLFSCRQIVRAHGGEIGVFSRTGAGTRVSLSLPLRVPSPAAHR